MPIATPARFVTKITGLALGVFVCLMVAGCAPKDPLDWKIHADTPDDINDWWQRKKDLMPQNLAIELNASFETIFNKLEFQRVSIEPENGFDPFCLRVNHASIRDVIVDAYLIADESLLSKIITTQNELIKNVDLSASDDTTAKQSPLDQIIGYQKKQIDELNKELQHNRARIKELEPEADKK